MKNQDNNFKRALLKELTGFSYKDKDGAPVADADDGDSFDFAPVAAETATATATAPNLSGDFTYVPNQTAPMTETLSTTLISKATIINGGVQTRENITVDGIVNGDIVSKGKVVVKGKVDGDVTGYDIDISCEELCGDINCESKAIIHASTKLKGNLFTGKATVIGTVEGNIIAKESVELLQNAIVYGDIKSASITVSEGAIIYGMVTIGKTKPETPNF